MITTVRRSNRRRGDAQAAGPADSVPPDVPSSRPRPVRLTGAGRFVVFLAVLLTTGSIAGGAWLLALADRDRDLRRRVATEAVSARAEVVALSRTRGDEPRYLVDYAYTAAGRTFEVRRTIRRSMWSRLQPGSPLDVGYLPDAPDKSWVAGYEPQGLPLWLGPVVALACAVVAWLAWRELRRQWMLLSEGRPALARVTGSKKVANPHGGNRLHVSYQYRLLSGATRIGKYAAEKAPPPADGTTIRIVYDPDNPGHSSRYPLSLVRIA